MIDSHIHLSYRDYDQNFTYIDYDGIDFKVVEGGRRQALIEEMKRRGFSCCIEPAIDDDSKYL